MSGHQSLLWHMGILAKAYAAEAVVEALRAEGRHATAAWLVVDTDAQDVSSLFLPALDDAGRRCVVERSLTPRGDANGPTGFMPPMRIDPRSLPPGVRAPSAEIESRFAEIAWALSRAAEAPTLAAQMTRALVDLLGQGWPMPRIVFSSALARTTLFRALVARLQADPGGAVLAHNAAARATPEAELRELAVESGRVELPLWRVVTQNGVAVRQRVYAGEDLDQATLAPRALLLTMLMRSAGCELFIHGLGGERYDQAMERWWRAWNPWDQPLRKGPPLAPSVMATADVFPSLEGLPPPTEVVAREARQKARRARDNPRLVGDVDAAEAKEMLLAEIARLPRHDPARRLAFLSLRTLVDAHRVRHADALQGLLHEAATAGVTSGLDPAARRDLSCVLYASASLAELRRRVHQAVSG